LLRLTFPDGKTIYPSANDALAHVLDWGVLIVAVAALVFVLSLSIR
jgi:hypothetical protein